MYHFNFSILLSLKARKALNFTEWTEMNLELILMSENDIAEFKKNVQYAFQKGFEDVFGKCEETILPEKDIDQSLIRIKKQALSINSNIR